MEDRGSRIEDGRSQPLSGCTYLRIEDGRSRIEDGRSRSTRLALSSILYPRSSILDSRGTVGKLIWKSAGVKLQRQSVRCRPQPPLRSGVIGNTLGFDPRDSRFDPWLRSSLNGAVAQ